MATFYNFGPCILCEVMKIFFNLIQRIFVYLGIHSLLFIDLTLENIFNEKNIFFKTTYKNKNLWKIIFSNILINFHR